MQFRSLLWLLPVSILTSLLQGCGSGGGGGGGGGGDRGYSPSITKHADGSSSAALPKLSESERKESADDGSLGEVFHKGHNIPMSERGRLSGAEERLYNAYRNSNIKNLPNLEMMFVAGYVARMSSDQNLQKKMVRRQMKLGAYDVAQDLDGVIEVMEAITKDLEANDASLPSIQGQGVLRKSNDQQWHFHFAFLNQLRKHMNGEQRFNELDKDMPMVADINGNNALLTGLQDDQWYVYGQGYAFRGHWEPTKSTRQDYTGKGMEFGLLKALQNDWILGGTFSFQKLDMEIGKGKASADVYRIGPFASWSNDRWSVDSMLTYGWVNMKTSQGQWSGAPKGSEWAAHVQSTYTLPLDQWAIGLKLVPEAYLGYRVGNIDGHDMKSGNNARTIISSKQTGLTTRLGTGLNYTFADLSSPTDVGIKVGLEKTFMWQEDSKSSNAQWAKTPAPESRDTSVYYGIGLHRQFGASLDKLIGLDYMGSKGESSGSDALTLTYRQSF